jgi:UDP-N-acetylglucosamine--N-acetylmuramyl-(pentapeptide) pyrophosphoryl-undecaprenol N-acetylglucosamine transferase
MATRSPLRLIIAAGGTGGHVLPAVAVLRELRERQVPMETLWIGGQDGIEARAAQEEGVQFAEIPTGKLRRYFDVRTARDTINIPRGVLAARKLVRSFRPDVVFSTGGFVSVPTVLASRGRASVLTHEQTTIIGLANKINLRSADVIAVSFQHNLDRLERHGRRVLVTGNPVRREVLVGDAERGRAWFQFTHELPVTLILGGARGASPINERIKSMLPKLLEMTQVVHQTGPTSANQDFTDLSAYRASLPHQLARRYAVSEYIAAELPDVYAMADLVVSRAGAGTVAELAAVGKPAILIPLPLSGGGEQISNARALADHGAALMVMQSEATPERLLTEIESLLSDHERRLRMASTARSFGRPDAASRLADALLELASKESEPTLERG